MNSPKRDRPDGTLTAVASVSQGRPGSTCHRLAPARPGADRCRTPAAEFRRDQLSRGHDVDGRDDLPKRWTTVRSNNVTHNSRSGRVWAHSSVSRSASTASW